MFSTVEVQVLYLGVGEAKVSTNCKSLIQYQCHISELPACLNATWLGKSH